MILLIGGSGILGQAFLRVFDQKHIEYMAPSSKELDITKSDMVLKFFNKNIDLIVHCAAYTAVDQAETDQEACNNVNITGLEHLLALKIPILHFSSDYVFNGKSDEYFEVSEPNPLNVYGHSKRKAEELLESSNGDWWNIRTSWLYGTGGKNFVDTILALSESNDEISVANDQVSRPTNAHDLANAVVENFITKTRPKGHYHIQGKGKPVTWAQFAEKIIEISEKDLRIKHEPLNSEKYPAKRPERSVLLDTKLNHQMPKWEESLERYLDKVFR